MRNGDQRASTAFLERTKKESLYNIEEVTKQTWRSNCEDRPSLFHPHAHQTRSTGLETLAGRHACVKGYIQRMLSATFRDEDFNLSRIHVFIVVDLISDLSATCGLNFRTTVASCSFWMILIFFVFPCCVAVNPVFQKSRCAVQFLDGDLVLQMFSFVPWPYLCMFWF